MINWRRVFAFQYWVPRLMWLSPSGTEYDVKSSHSETALEIAKSEYPEELQFQISKDQLFRKETWTGKYQEGSATFVLWRKGWSRITPFVGGFDRGTFAIEDRETSAKKAILEFLFTVNPEFGSGGRLCYLDYRGQVVYEGTLEGAIDFLSNTTKLKTKKFVLSWGER